MAAGTVPGSERPLAESVYPGTLDCVHCGLCLPVCPTYRETGSEVSSPRGRVLLMRAVAEGEAELGGVLAEEAYLCLGCRACESECPSGVRFGRLLEETRSELARAGVRHGLTPSLERFALRHVVAHPGRLRRVLGVLGWAQRLGMDRAARLLLPRRLRALADQAPRVPPRRERAPLPEILAAVPPRRGRVGLLAGCVMPELFGAVNHATARVLCRNGFEVVTPAGQGCCGALHAHAGDLDFARRLARRNLEAFSAARVDAVVVNAAGCGAALREVHHWLPGSEAEGFARSVRDVCEWLDEAGLRAPPGRLALRVCYDDPCHLVHAQGVREAPRHLLRQVEGLELVEHDDPTACCGAAGTYNLTHPEMAGAVLARKLRALQAVDPDIVATGNPGCLMQLRAGAARAGLRARVLHPIELLAGAYEVG